MLCFHKDCTHYKQYRIGCCPMFKSRCQYQPKPPRRTRHSKPRLQRYTGYTKHGLSPAQRDKLRKYQNNCCDMCGANPTRLVLDHDHKTGKARGYLCDSCNHRLSGVENKSFRAKALDYLANSPVDRLNLILKPIPTGGFTCPNRSCMAYSAYLKGACPYFDSKCLYDNPSLESL